MFKLEHVCGDSESCCSCVVEPSSCRDLWNFGFFAILVAVMMLSSFFSGLVWRTELVVEYSNWAGFPRSSTGMVGGITCTNGDAAGPEHRYWHRVATLCRVVSLFLFFFGLFSKMQPNDNENLIPMNWQDAASWPYFCWVSGSADTAWYRKWRKRHENTEHVSLAGWQPRSSSIWWTMEAIWVWAWERNNKCIALLELVFS